MMTEGHKSVKSAAPVEGPTVCLVEDLMLHGKRFNSHGYNYKENFDDNCSLADSSVYTANTKMSQLTGSSSAKITGSLSWWIVSRRKQIIEANRIIDSGHEDNFDDEEYNNVDSFNAKARSPSSAKDHSASCSSIGASPGGPIESFSSPLPSNALVKAPSPVKVSSSLKNSGSKTSVSWSRAVTRARMASIMIQAKFRQTIAKKRVQCLAHERQMTLVIIRMIARWVYRLRLRQRNATKLRAAMKIQRVYRGLKGRSIALQRVVAGIKVNEAYARFLQIAHLKLSMRRIERPLLITLRRVNNLRMADIVGNKVKIRVSIWWHNVLHTANAADVTAILETKKPHFVHDTALYNVTVSGDKSANGEQLGEVVFNSSNIAASHNLFSGLTHGVSDVAHNLTHGVSDVAHSLGHGVTDVAHSLGHGVSDVAHSIGIGRSSNGSAPINPTNTGTGTSTGTGSARADDSSTEPKSGNNSLRKTGLNLLPSLRGAKVATREISLVIPACHGNCYIRFDLMDEPGRNIGHLSYAMPKHNRLMFWGTPKNSDGTPGIEKGRLKFSRGLGPAAQSASSSSSNRGSQHGSKLSSLPIAKGSGLVSGGRQKGGDRLGVRRKITTQDESAFPVMDFRVVPGIKSEWVIMQVSGAGPFARKQLQQHGVFSATLTLLAKHKNYFRHMMSLLPDRIEFYKSRGSHDPEFELDLTSVVSVEEELSTIVCYANQIDPSIPMGDSAPIPGAVNKKNVIDTYDIVVHLDTDDTLYIRLATAKKRRLWLVTLIEALEKNLERIELEEAAAAKLAAEVMANDTKRAASKQTLNLSSIGSSILRRASVSLGLSRRSPVAPPPLMNGGLVKSLSMKLFAIPDDCSDDSSSSDSDDAAAPTPPPKKYVRRMSTLDASGVPALSPPPVVMKRQSSLERVSIVGGAKSVGSSGSNGKSPLRLPVLKRLNSDDARADAVDRGSSESPESSVDSSSSASKPSQSASTSNQRQKPSAPVLDRPKGTVVPI